MFSSEKKAYKIILPKKSAEKAYHQFNHRFFIRIAIRSVLRPVDKSILNHEHGLSG
jgi:hypothetical protein